MAPEPGPGQGRDRLPSAPVPIRDRLLSVSGPGWAPRYRPGTGSRCPQTGTTLGRGSRCLPVSVPVRDRVFAIRLLQYRTVRAPRCLHHPLIASVPQPPPRSLCPTMPAERGRRPPRGSRGSRARLLAAGRAFPGNPEPPAPLEEVLKPELARNGRESRAAGSLPGMPRAGPLGAAQPELKASGTARTGHPKHRSRRGETEARPGTASLGAGRRCVGVWGLGTAATGSHSGVVTRRSPGAGSVPGFARSSIALLCLSCIL